jgi:hypothetical protein
MMMKLKSIISVFIILFFNSAMVIAANETIPTGSYIIDMGVVPQTVQNSLKPYGLVYALIKNHKIPIKWIISPTKAKDGIDFSHNGYDFKGGPFIITAGFRTPEVNALIATWEAKGVKGKTTISPVVVPVYTTINYYMAWTLDAQNGKIAEVFLKSAEMPIESYHFQDPDLLNCCNDLYVMPHADPTWETHKNLFYWNKGAADGGCQGAIYASCHAVSVLENLFNPTNPTERMNFLMKNPISPSVESAVPFGSHTDGTPPYKYDFPTHPVMQLIGTIDAATQNGSEQIFLPKSNGWRPETMIGVWDSSQTNIPALSPGKAALIAFGQGMGDTYRGRVMYEAAHNIAKSSAAENIAAQRAFFNFAYWASEVKAIQVASTIPLEMIGNKAYNVSVSASGGAGGYVYKWTSTCAGTFANPNVASTTFTPANVADTTTCIVSCLVTDACGSRTTFVSIKVDVEPNIACNPLTNGGQIGSNQSNCQTFMPALLTNTTAPTGGLGTIEYQWLKNTVSSNPSDANWVLIANSNSATFAPPSVSSNIYYMRQAKRTACTDWLSSNVVSLTLVSPIINVSTNTNKVCPYGEIVFTATVNPTGNYSFQWQKSTDGVNWTDIPDAVTAVKTISIVGKADYRVVVKSVACTFYSTPLSISTFDTTPPVFSNKPNDVTVACNAIPPPVILNATDDCYLQDIVFHETYSSCINPTLNTNGGLENTANLPMDTTFYGYPARKLPNYDQSINGWEMGFPATNSEKGLLVHDNNNSINNPEGNDFLWIPGNGFCVLNAPINLKAGQCIEISLWAAALSKLNPQEATRIQVEVFNMNDNSVVVPFSQVLPAGTSINNMNWQKIVTRFAVPANGSYRFVVTQSFEPDWGASAKGMAIDGFFIKECCTMPPVDCKNYTITRIWTARDVTGNVTKHTQVITVKDTQAPTFNNVPANITICGTTVPTAAILTATDNCDATPSVSLASEVSTKTTNGSCTDNFYTVTRVWKAADNCGNAVTATQVITVVAPVTPTIAAVSNCSTSTTNLTAVTGSCITNANFQWQKWDGVNWVNVGTNQNTFDTPVLTTNQDYRVVVTVPNATCSGTSATYTAQPVKPLEVTIGTTNSTVCLNSVAAIAASAKGGVGVLTYQWQSSTDNTNWTNIAGANSALYLIPTTSVSNKFYRVIVSANTSGCNSVTSSSLPVKVESSAGCDCVLQACDAYTKLVYKNPVQINDAAGLVGDKWRFSNVAAGFDAIVEVTNALNANSLNAIDNTAVNVDDWCPEINFNFLAGKDSYVDWKITIVAAGTNTPANLPTSSRVTSYDVDGNANYREMHGHINANGYIVNNPTELVIANEPPFTLVLGSTNEYTSISTDSKVKATFYYPGQNNVFSIRLGVRTVNAVGAAFRQFAVSFDPCISYTSPDINPQKPEIVGTTATCVGSSNATYTTTQPFNTYNWMVAGGTIVSGQGTRNIIVDWTSTGAKTVSISTVDANGCMGTTSFAVTVNTDPTVALVDANSALLCEGESTVLTAKVSGGVGTPTYQWQSSLDGIVWNQIAGATNLNYDVTGSNLGVKYYQLVVTFGNNECNKVTSSSKQVESVSALALTSVLEGFTECLGGTRKLKTQSQGGKNTTYQWQSSVDNVNWVDIVGEIDTVYMPPSTVAGTKYYRVSIKSASAGCGTILSEPATVIVVPDPAVNVSVSVSKICAGGTAVLTANVADPSGTCAIQWQSNSNGATWNDILNETKPSLTVGALNSTTRYRIILNCSGSGCCN